MEISNLPDKFKPLWKNVLPILKQGRPGDDVHASEVVEFILNYKGEMNLDLDILIPTAMMHDIGHSAILPEHIKYVTGGEKLPNGKLVHMLVGAKIAKEILESIDYDKEKSKEIVDIISMHDMDQLKNIDTEKFYNSTNKKIFHDIDCLDRYSEKRLKSIEKLYPGKTKEDLIEIINKQTNFFFEEIKDIAENRLKELESPKKTLRLLFDRKGFNLYPFYFADKCLTKDIKDIFGKNISKIICEFKKNFLFYYADTDQFNDIGEYLLNRIINDKNFYNEVEKNILISGDELLDFCNNLPKDLKGLSNQGLVDIYNEYETKTRKIRSWGWVPPLVDGAYIYFLSDYLQEKIRSHMSSIGLEEKASEYYSILSSAEKMSEINSEEIERLELIKKLEEKGLTNNLESEEAKKLIKAHAEKFEWLTYAYIGPKMNQDDVKKLIKDSLSKKESIDEQIKTIYDHFNNIKNKKQEIIKKINLPSDLIYLSDVSSFFMHLKDMRKGIYQKSYVLMDPVIEEIAKRLNLTIQETKYLTGEELEQALIKNVDFSEIAKIRTEYCVSVTENGNTSVYINEADNVTNNNILEEHINQDITEFKGSTAYSGKIKAIAKIILTKEDIPKLKQGEILVSSATNPELISAMKIAGAFITDTGGITCHAAIVSRELKKPCIIGTKIATKVIKDGDLVEVNADEGIVRILNSNLN